jgi:hypothetical protein
MRTSAGAPKRQSTSLRVAAVYSEVFSGIAQSSTHLVECSITNTNVFAAMFGDGRNLAQVHAPTIEHAHDSQRFEGAILHLKGGLDPIVDDAGNNLLLDLAMHANPPVGRFK